jgi:ubiquitin-protein ligase
MDLQRNSEYGCTVNLVSGDEAQKDNFCHWQVTIEGPEGSLHEHEIFVVNITFGVDYSAKPPSVMFATPIYHPNISITTGMVCSSTLKEWDPETKMSAGKSFE